MDEHTQRHNIMFVSLVLLVTQEGTIKPEIFAAIFFSVLLKSHNLVAINIIVANSHYITYKKVNEQLMYSQLAKLN